jgi:hypothetical protein
MDTDAKTTGQCKHGNFYDTCRNCEDEYTRKCLEKSITGRAAASLLATLPKADASKQVPNA